MLGDKSILIVDDDARLSSMLAEYLQSNRYIVSQAFDLAQAIAMIHTQRPDCLILDVMLPDGDGLEFCKTLRAKAGEFVQLPILMLTAKGDAFDKALGLELGADDYMGKPFEPRELLARVKALLRRAPAQQVLQAPTLRFGRLNINIEARDVYISEVRCELTAYQFDLIAYLARHAGMIMSREQLMNAVKQASFDAYDRSIDVHIARIRAEIEADPKDPQRIKTVRGVGYVFAKQQD